MTAFGAVGGGVGVVGEGVDPRLLRTEGLRFDSAAADWKP